MTRSYPEKARNCWATSEGFGKYRVNAQLVRKFRHYNLSAASVENQHIRVIGTEEVAYVAAIIFKAVCPRSSHPPTTRGLLYVPGRFAGETRDAGCVEEGVKACHQNTRTLM